MRRADRSVAPVVVAGNVLVGGALLWMAIGGTGNPATRAEETAALLLTSLTIVVALMALAWPPSPTATGSFRDHIA